MPQDSNSNINSKEKISSSNHSDSEIAELIQASQQLRISLLKFESTLNKISRTSAAQTSVPASTYVDTKAENKIPISINPSTVKSNTLETKFGFTVGDTVQILNPIKNNGYLIPERYRYGVVTRFNKRFVYFDIKYLKGSNWISYEAYREPKNLKRISPNKAL